jgi:hypothetical protein
MSRCRHVSSSAALRRSLGDGCAKNELSDAPPRCDGPRPDPVITLVHGRLAVAAALLLALKAGLGEEGGWPCPHW